MSLEPLTKEQDAAIIAAIKLLTDAAETKGHLMTMIDVLVTRVIMAVSEEVIFTLMAAELHSQHVRVLVEHFLIHGSELPDASAH